MLPVYQLLKFLSLYNMTIYYNDNTFYVHSKSPKKICKMDSLLRRTEGNFSIFGNWLSYPFLDTFYFYFKVHMDSVSLIYFYIVSIAFVLFCVLFCFVLTLKSIIWQYLILHAIQGVHGLRHMDPWLG